MKSKTQVVNTLDTVLISMMIALTVIGARISLPIGPVPITLQTLVIILNGLLLGPRLGWVAPSLYLVMGLVGLPFFSKGGGISYLAQPTFGFLLGFIPAAVLAGWIYQWKLFHSEYVNALLGSMLGMILIYVIGFSYIPLVSSLWGSKTAVWATLITNLPFMIIGDCLKIFFVASVLPLLKKELEHVREMSAEMIQ
jgi:biotin transport system substrate-specific component